MAHGSRLTRFLANPRMIVTCRLGMGARGYGSVLIGVDVGGG
jgi:hypothetical protein